MPVPITDAKRSVTTTPGRWIAPLTDLSRSYDGVAVRAARQGSAGVLIIVQEASLPEPDPELYGTNAEMYYASPGDTYPLGNYADNRTRVWLRGEGDAAVDVLIWPVRN